MDDFYKMIEEAFPDCVKIEDKDTYLPHEILNGCHIIQTDTNWGLMDIKVQLYNHNGNERFLVDITKLPKKIDIPGKDLLEGYLTKNVKTGKPYPHNFVIFEPYKRIIVKDGIENTVEYCAVSFPASNIKKSDFGIYIEKNWNSDFHSFVSDAIMYIIFYLTYLGNVRKDFQEISTN
jgi:hypothetical protein